MKIYLTKEQSDDIISLKLNRLNNQTFVDSVELIGVPRYNKNNIEYIDCALVSGEHLVYGDKMGGVHYIYSSDEDDDYSIIYDWVTSLVVEERNKKINDLGL